MLLRWWSTEKQLTDSGGWVIDSDLRNSRNILLSDRSGPSTPIRVSVHIVDAKVYSALKQALGSDYFHSSFYENNVWLMTSDMRLIAYFLKHIMNHVQDPSIYEACQKILAKTNAQAYEQLPNWIFDKDAYYNLLNNPNIKNISVLNQYWERNTKIALNFNDSSKINVCFNQLHAHVSIRTIISYDDINDRFPRLKLKVKSSDIELLQHAFLIIQSLYPELGHIKNEILEKVEKMLLPHKIHDMKKYATSFEILAVFSDHPNVRQVMNVWSEIELGLMPLTSENLQALRAELFILLNNVNNHLADQAYESLIHLGSLSPINDVDPITQEPIDPQNRFVISTGFQFDIHSLAQDVRLRNKFENSLTRETFNARDKSSLRKACAEKSISLNSSSTATPLVQASWMGSSGLDSSQQETENYYFSMNRYL